MNKKILMSVLIVAIIAIVIITGYEVVIADKKGPKITFTKDTITYTEGENKQKLLVGVTAHDETDGDVTNSLRIKSIVISKDHTKAKITYAAKDSKNNVTTDYRNVDYIAADHTADQNDEQESKQEESTQETTTVAETIDKAAVDASGIPVILLTSSEATIKVNENFNQMNYVKEVYDNTDQDISRRIRIVGKWDNTQPGDYPLTYSVRDKEGNVSQPVNFT